MSSNRDNFTRETKQALALRAGYLCSLTGCGKTTIGPSKESSMAIATTGTAAHISGAASGPGSRRYDQSMTSEQRRDISNGIWLCADHAIYIDRDEVTYTVESLKAMKQAREDAQAMAQLTGAKGDMGAGLLGIGPVVICTGDIVNVSADSWTLRLKHFAIGDHHDLIAFISGFDKVEAQDRYVLSNDLGDGRVLSAAPSLTKAEDGYLLLCPVEPSFPRVDARKIGSTSEQDENGDMFLRNGNIARVSGVDALPQNIRSALSMQRGENVFHPNAGVRFFEYFRDYKGSPYLAQLMKLDVIRQAAIPYPGTLGLKTSTPLHCVTRVVSFEVLSDIPVNNRLPVHATFDVLGIGEWEHEFSVYMPTQEQMEERARFIAQRPSLHIRN